MCNATNCTHITANYVRRTTKGWAVYYQRTGKRLSRYYKTKKAAKSRLRQIKSFANTEPLTPSKLEQDPTQQAGNRRAAKAEIKRRIQSAREPILQLLDSIPVDKVEVQNVYSPTASESGYVNRVKYQYLLEADRLLEINDEIRRIINGVLQLEMQTGMPQRWFFERYLEKAYREGTAQSAARMSAQVAGTGVVPFTTERALELETILMSEPYRRRIETLYARAFENMKGFAGQAAEDLGRLLGTGVALGQSPRKIAADMRKKFTQIEGYRALRIARTEVNQAFTNARLEQTEDARERLGIDARVMHISALVPNTRATHAARHGRLYTPQSQLEWWSQGSNRISCLCSTIEIVYMDGEPLQKDLIERFRARGKQYFAAYPDKAAKASARGAGVES